MSLPSGISIQLSGTYEDQQDSFGDLFTLMYLGKPRILPRCKLPLTAAKQVDLIITELGVFRCEKPGLVLTELAKGATLERVTQFTPAPYAISPDLLREAY